MTNHTASKSSIILLAIIAVTCFFILGGSPVQAGDDKPILRVERQNLLLGSAVDHNIYIDGVKVGEVSNGGKKEFELPVGKECKIVVSAFLNSSSDEIRIIPKPGSIHLLSTSMGFSVIAKHSIVKEGRVAAHDKLVGEVSFDNMVTEKEISRELYKTLPGVSRTISVEHSYERTVTNTTTMGSETSVSGKAGVDFIASISVELKGKIDSSLGITIGEKKTVTDSFTLNGVTSSKAYVVWIGRYKQGTITLSDGKRVSVLVCVGVRMELEEAK